MLLARLVAGDVVAVAAAAAGMSERTARRRLADPAFRAQVNALRAEVLGAAASTLAARMTSAVNVLAKLMDDEASPAHVRCSAASRILELAVKFGEAVQLEERIRILEEAAAAGKGA